MDYQDLVKMGDEKFFSDIPRVLHFICIVCYLKETPSHLLLDDEGLVHQLVHMMDDTTKDDPLIDNPQTKQEIRQAFKILCELA